MRVNSKSVPSPAGVQSCIVMPLGTYSHATRRGPITALAAVVAPNAREGIIASKKGSAIAVPIPLSTVLREIGIIHHPV